MNKLTSLIVLALVACVSAQSIEDWQMVDDGEEFSQMSIMPSNENEVRYLNGDNKIFSEFCIESRDEVKKFLTESTHSAAATVFEVLFTSINQAGTEILSAEKEAVEEGAKLIEQGSVMPEPNQVASEEEIKERLDETVQRVSLMQTVSNAVKMVVNAVIEAARGQTVQRLALLRSKFNGESLKDKIQEACQAVTFQLKRRLDDKLSAAKNDIKRSNSGNPQLLEVAQRTRLENVGCVTTGRVGKVSTFCDVLRMAGPTIFPLIGL